MSFFNWRKLNFFDIAKEVDGGCVTKNLDGAELTCSTSGRGNLILGDSTGNIWIYNRHWESNHISGWDGPVIQLVLPRQSNILLGIGNESGVRCLKVWDLEKENNLVRVSRLSIPGSPSEPVVLAVSDNLQLIAVGYENGAVCLYRGDVTKDKGSKQKFLIENGEPISGLSFSVTSSSIVLYVATVKDIFLFYVNIKDRESRVVLDQLGCQPGLCVSTSNFNDAHFITGQKDALYFYNPEGRGQCYVFEGKKKSLNWFRGYLSVALDDGTGKDSVTIFDVQNKIICFSAPVRTILCLAAEWGTILLISSDGRILQLIEKDLQSKLDMLFKKNFYDVAVKIARHQNMDKEGLVDIFRQFGDHLYAKGDHSGAIDQYEKTIGSLEPSYVIRKFLDTQKIHNLTAYLQALHRKGSATEDHTTLLLNCYTKLKDSANLDAFIMTKDREIDFDVDIAISVCRKAGYLKHALSLAEKHAKHDLYLKIQIDDQKDYQEALKYIRTLPGPEIEEQLQKYGSVLIEQVVEETTSLLKDLCSESWSRPELFIPLFVNSGSSRTNSGPDRMLDYLNHVVQTTQQLTPQVWNTLLEYNLDVYKQTIEQKDRAAHEERIMDILAGDNSNYDPEQALVLCQLNHFPGGFLYLYQRAGLYEQILKYHFQAGHYEEGIIACRRFGPQNPNLWISALQSVAASGADVPQQYFKEVLENIEKNRLLSPLLVVTTLSSCPTATLGVVRDYLIRTLAAEEESIAEDRRTIDQYTTDTKSVRDTIHSLRTEAVVFQSTKCSACNNSLDLPSVHFLCQHGYHQHCFQSLADNEQECPKCSEENKKITDIIRSQDAGRSQHDQFHAQLEKAEDGFSIVAEYFGRGLFSTPAPPVNIQKQVTGQGRVSPQGISENLSTVSEARLRANERQVQGYGQTHTDSEARLRLAQQGGGGGEAERSEGRLRAEMKGGGGQPLVQEGRLRAGQPSQVIANVPSDGRLRVEEGTRQPARPAHGRISSNLTRQTVDRGSPVVFPEVKPARGVSPVNPFGSPDQTADQDLEENNPFADTAAPSASKSRPSASANPFGSPGPSPLKSTGLNETNPFGSSPDDNNPFGGDYDDQLNPFDQ